MIEDVENEFVLFRMSDIDGDEVDVFPDFTQPDEMSSIVLLIEGQKLYIYKEILAAWSPVFKSMFIRDFKEKTMSEIELPGKTVDSFTELLHCMYPPIKPISGLSPKQQSLSTQQTLVYWYCLDERNVSVYLTVV